MEKTAVKTAWTPGEKQKSAWKTLSARNAPWLFLLMFCFAAVSACLALYRYDNKYTYGGPQGVQGVLQLDEEEMARWPVVMLVEGWEYYAGVLLSPGQLEREGRQPDRYLYIGHYGGFEMGDPGASPHGSGSYRLVLQLPQAKRMYTLELPEIFSAYRCYIGGELTAQMGNPDPAHYVPQTLNRTVSFEAGGRVEILIAVSDFSHFYSGMVYPPAFGQPDGVNHLLAVRFFFCAALCVVALFAAALSLFVGMLGNKRALGGMYALICLLFVCYISYPVVKTFLPGYFPFYAIEQVAYGGMLVSVMLLWRRICGMKTGLSLVPPAAGGAICVAAAAVHLLLPMGSLGMIYAYSRLITAGQWLTAGYLTAVTLLSVRRRALATGPMLAGIAAFDVALVMDRLLPAFEPIVLRWFPELSSFVLVLSAGVMAVGEITGQYQKSATLEERNHRMRQFVEMQRTYYPQIQEKVALAQTARHDLRHHLVAIAAMVDSGRYEGLRDYLDHYRERLETPGTLRYSENEVADILAHHYMRRAEAWGIDLTLELGIGAELRVAPDDLSAVLGNLLENGIEACRRQAGRPFLTLTARMRGTALTLRMENSCSEIRADGGEFLSTKGESGGGYGLGSIKAIAGRYRGTADFHHHEDTGIFVSRVILETD